MARASGRGGSAGAPYVIAALLGVAAAALSRAFLPPLLTEETPQFVFGTAVVLFVFLQFGQGPGLLAGLIHSVGLAPTVIAPGSRLLIPVISLLPLVEAWGIWRLNRWLQSPMLAAAVFWLGIGWLLDIAGYGWLGRLPFEYLALLFLKHLINGTLNALFAEVAWRAMPARWRGAEATEAIPIRNLIRGRLFLLALPIVIVLGLLYVRSAFQQVIDRAQIDQQRDAGVVASAIRRALDTDDAALQRLAATIGPDLSPAAIQARIEAFHAAHPEHVNIGVTDSTGRVIASSPKTDADGGPIIGMDISDREYFRTTRATLAPVSPPLVRGRLRAHRPVVDMMMLRSYPLIDRAGRFTGALVSGYDVTRLSAVATRAATGRSVTLFDTEQQVIVSSIRSWPQGLDLKTRLPPGTNLRVPSGTFKFSTTNPNIGTQFQLDLRQAFYTLIDPVGWGVMVDRLSTSLHATLLPVVGRILIAVLLLVALLVIVVARTSHELAGPLLTVSREARRVASGQPGASSSLAALRTSPASEVRDLGADFELMAEAVADQRVRSLAREGDVERRFHAAFHNPVLGMLHTDLTGRVLRVNDRVCDILGLSQEEITRQRWGLPPSAGAEPSYDREIERLLRGDANAVVKEWTFHRGAHRVTIRSIATLVDPDGRGTPSIIVTVEDLSPQRELERRLTEAQRLEAIGLLAGGVAHDFNNLLTPIIGYTEMARADLPAGATQDDLGAVLKAARRARDLVQQLLAFGRRQTLEIRPIEPNRLLEEVKTLLAPVVPPTIRLVVSAQPDLGLIEVDAAQMEQVLMNLAVNAVDSMPNGGDLVVEARPVELGAAGGATDGLPAGSYVAIDVRDTGSGIDTRSVPKLFEPFFTTKEPGKGTGLGLAMAHGIVAQHRGTIRVTSALGMGSTFTIFLPRVSGVELADREAAGRAAPRRGAGTVLVAEDEPAVRALIARILSRNGYEVLAGGSAEEAEALATGHLRPIRLLLTDVVMPGRSGPELYDRLRSSRPELQVLFISGFAGDVLGGPERLGPGAGFLQKPFSNEELLERVAAAVGTAGRG